MFKESRISEFKELYCQNICTICTSGPVRKLLSKSEHKRHIMNFNETGWKRAIYIFWTPFCKISSQHVTYPLKLHRCFLTNRLFYLSRRLGFPLSDGMFLHYNRSEHYLSRSTSNHFQANDIENSFVQLHSFIEWNQEQVLKKIFSLILLWYMRRLTHCLHTFQS